MGTSAGERRAGVDGTGGITYARYRLPRSGVFGAGGRETIDIALSAAVTATPREAQSIVLGCTHYGLVADRIEAAFDRPVALFDSPPAVARQLARRLATQVVSEDPAEVVSDPQSPQVPATPQASTPPTGRLTHVFSSGKPGSLPAAVEAYSVGRELLALQDKTE